MAAFQALKSKEIKDTAKNMVYRGQDKPIVEISLDDEDATFIPTYTNLETIRGNVTFKAPIDTTINQVRITFEGISKTCVEKIGTAAPTNEKTLAISTFLDVVHPYPPSQLAEAGKVCSFPFSFIVPDGVLAEACDHDCVNDVVRQHHLRLPPTMGDPMTAASGKTLGNDMCPESAVVSYSIKARVTSGSGSNGAQVPIGDALKKIRVIPTVAEAPPLTVQEGQHEAYRLRKVRNIKRGTLQKRLGTLVMEADQPLSFCLPPPKTASEPICPITQKAKVRLRFDPATADAVPPQLSSLETKLKAATFYATLPWEDTPHRDDETHYSNTKGLYVHSIPLSSRCVSTVTWKKHPASESRHQEPAGVDVSDPSSSIPAPSTEFHSEWPYYTAEVLDPMTLPEKSSTKGNRLFVPTFHSCLVSRFYILHFYLSFVNPGMSIKDHTLHIKLPIQVSSAPSPHAGSQTSPTGTNVYAGHQPAEGESDTKENAPLPQRPSYAEATGSVSQSPRSPQSPGFPGFEDAGAAQISRANTAPLDGLPPPDYSDRRSRRLGHRTTATRSPPVGTGPRIDQNYRRRD
ncbi:MAG: hypothetical protein Q9174_002636 [Haloplaca sp. 1 TL-2023]